MAVHRRWRGRQARPIGRQRLDEIAGRHRREELDVEEMEAEFKSLCSGRRREVRRRSRLLDVRELESGTYRFYLTDIAPERFSTHRRSRRSIP